MQPLQVDKTCNETGLTHCSLPFLIILGFSSQKDLHLFLCNLQNGPILALTLV